MFVHLFSFVLGAYPKEAPSYYPEEDDYG